MEKLEFKTGSTQQTKRSVESGFVSAMKTSKRTGQSKIVVDIFYGGKINGKKYENVGPAYFTFKDGKLSSKKQYKGYKMPSKVVFAIKESVVKKKEKLNEGMVMISSLLPVGGLIGMPPKRKDNFVFKGLPGQFNEQGEKVFDEFGDPIKEDRPVVKEEQDAKYYKNLLAVI